MKPNYTNYTQPSPNPRGSLNQVAINIDKDNDPGLEGKTPVTFTCITDETIRRSFIRKVLGIIFFQMLISIGFVMAALFIKKFQTFQRENVYLFLIALFVEILLFFVLACNKKFCRKVPYNYICLIIFTIAVSYILSYICARTQPEAVLAATIATGVIVFLLGLFSFFSKKDITRNIVIIFYLPVAGLIIILFLSVWSGAIIQIIISLVIVAIFSIFLAYDLQKLSGKFGDEYSIDDYVYAALNIYIDIVLIFKNLLYIFGGSS